MTTAAMNNWFIGCNCRASFSAATISRASLCSNIFSAFSILSNCINSLSSERFSQGCFSPIICSKLIFCIAKASFSYPVTFIASLPSWTILSQVLAIPSIDKSDWATSLTAFQSLFSPSTYNVFIGQFWTSWFQVCLSDNILSW